MNYRSFADLARTITANAGKVPPNIDLIVGIPRSGMMAASILALSLNLKFCDIGSFIRNSALETGRTRKSKGSHIRYPFDARNVLIVDDSVASGGTIQEVQLLVKACGFTGTVRYMAVYALPAPQHVDFHFEEVEFPRVFEWNLFHRRYLENCCVDMDGILCLDPSTDSNDDGERYVYFLANARPLVRPTNRIGHIVTSRLEKYRQQTTQWLDMHNIVYGGLHMLDLPSAAERQRRKSHASFKAAVYSSLHESVLFVESESQQALEIARRTAKPVLDFKNQVIVRPPLDFALISTLHRSLPARIRRRLRSLFRPSVRA